MLNNGKEKLVEIVKGSGDGTRIFHLIPKVTRSPKPSPTMEPRTPEPSGSQRGSPSGSFSLADVRPLGDTRSANTSNITADAKESADQTSASSTHSATSNVSVTERMGQEQQENRQNVLNSGSNLQAEASPAPSLSSAAAEFYRRNEKLSCPPTFLFHQVRLARLITCIIKIEI